jgi:Na+/proline symporter
VSTLDWIIVASYCVIAVGIGVALSRRASRGTDDYFLSGRSLPWWLAGTSMVATSFASDTPLLVTGWVRKRGVWGNWEWWGLAVSTVFAVFFFSRLWRRAGVVTEVELTEMRYSGRPAAALRGFKALYIGILFNCYAMGAWVMTGLVKVMGATTGWDKLTALGVVVSIALIYSVLAGLWGVVATDFIQFIVAVVGAVILAVYAVDAVGGLGQLKASLAGTGKLDVLPPSGDEGFWTSPMAWFAGMFLIQWWAWKNTDGGGIIIQRMAASRDEKEAVYATLWYNIAHYAIRSWPWILVGLASLLLLNDADFGGVVDDERAYPLMIMKLLPDGLRGLLIASFFAAFMSTADTHMNWGASYVLNDFYRRFLKKSADEKHYVWASRLISVIVMAGAVVAALFTDSIARAFTFILTVTAGIGVVNLARWFWWRVNAWSEIAVMVASVVAVLLQGTVADWLGVPTRIGEHALRNLFFTLTYMVAATGVVWIPVTFLTRPESDATLIAFYRRVRPPGPGWGRVRAMVPDAPPAPMGPSVVLWLLGTAAVFGATLGIGQMLIGSFGLGLGFTGVSAAILAWIVRRIRSEPA